MAKIFYISEILQFAIEKEREAFKLYEMLYKKVSKPEMKEVFQHLMRAEEKHRLLYESMLRNLEGQNVVGAPESEEYMAYMRELISASRRTKGPDDVKFDDLDEALDYAILREKDSILFYIGLKNFVPEEDRGKVDDIISEEAKHIVTIVDAKNLGIVQHFA